MTSRAIDIRAPAVGESFDIPAALALLQLMDSAFPVGSFTHSYGLEQAVRDGHVRDASGVERFVASVLALQASGSDARALARAHAAAAGGDRQAFVAADAALYATKGAAELRAASTATGRRLLQEVTAHPEGRGARVEWYLDEVEAGRAHGLHPVALAVVGAGLGVPAAMLVGGLLFSSANTMHQAAMRLLPVSHRDMQAALHRARAGIAGLTEAAVASADTAFDSFAPLQEIASMRHEGAAVRFFAS